MLRSDPSRANSEGAIRIVAFPEGLHQAVVFDRTSNGQRPASHLKALALTLVVGGLLLRNLLVDGASKALWALFAVALGVYFLEAFFTSTRRYLSTKSKPSTVMEKVAALKEEAPSAIWDLGVQTRPIS